MEEYDEIEILLQNLMAFFITKGVLNVFVDVVHSAYNMNSATSQFSGQCRIYGIGHTPTYLGPTILRRLLFFFSTSFSTSESNTTSEYVFLLNASKCKRKKKTLENKIRNFSKNRW